jgi:hypothetical protein
MFTEQGFDALASGSQGDRFNHLSVDFRGRSPVSAAVLGSDLVYFFYIDVRERSLELLLCQY